MKAIVIGNNSFSTTEEVADYVKKHGKRGQNSIMRVVVIEPENCPVPKWGTNEITGKISSMDENGNFVSENGYCYNISCFMY